VNVDGRLSSVGFFARVKITNTPRSKRVKRFEKAGFIKQYRAVLNLEQLGLGYLTAV
jgi:DNA-binding Lrp family transcriptional regulator